MANGRLAKDVYYLQKHVAAVSNGQAVVTEVDDNLEFIKLDILPNDGFYKGAKIRFQIVFSENYPEEVPQVLCMDRVYHPNIDVEVFAESEDGTVEGSNICVSLLDEWDSDMDLDHLVMAILFLMYNPNPGDALSVYFDSESHVNMEANIRLTLRGETLDGTKWPCLLVDDEDGEEKKKDEVGDTVPSTSENEGEANCNANESPVGTPEEVTPAVSSILNTSEVEEVAAGTESNNNNTTASTPSTDSNSDDSPSTPWNSDRLLKRQISALDDLSILDPKDFPVIEDQTGLSGLAVASTTFLHDGTGSVKAFVEKCSPCLKALFCNFGKRENDIHVQAFFAASAVDAEYSEVD